jgi:hypothetical protein
MIGEHLDARYQEKKRTKLVVTIDTRKTIGDVADYPAMPPGEQAAAVQKGSLPGPASWINWHPQPLRQRSLPEWRGPLHDLARDRRATTGGAGIRGERVRQSKRLHITPTGSWDVRLSFSQPLRALASVSARSGSSGSVSPASPPTETCSPHGPELVPDSGPTPIWGALSRRFRVPNSPPRGYAGRCYRALIRA